MKTFLQRFGSFICFVLSGFDRLRFRADSRLLNNVSGLGSYLYRNDLLIKEFPDHAEQLTRQLVRGTVAQAEAQGVPLRYLNSPNIDKEATALDIAQQRQLRSGAIAVFSSVENGRTFRVRKNAVTGHIELRKETTRCQHYYHYFLHEQLGLCHVRVQTWFPFTLRVVLNGRSWLCQQLQREGLAYRRQDNLLLQVQNPERAQQLLDEQLRTDWPALLQQLTEPVQPLSGYMQEHAPYYWMTEQSEWATDLVFHSAADLQRLYPRWLRHCIDAIGCRDILHFLGKAQPEHRFARNFRGEVKGDIGERHEGMRAKLWYQTNSVKIYDKAAQALRLETTINQPGSFTVYRAKENGPQDEKAWRPMRKGVADLHRRAEVSQRANERLAESLATVAEPTTLGQLLEPLGRPVLQGQRRWRALNPLTGADGELLRLIGRGDFLLEGFRNRDLRVGLYGAATDAAEQRRQSATVTRKLSLLRAHGLILRVQKTHRYQLTAAGRRLVTALSALQTASVETLTA